MTRLHSAVALLSLSLISYQLSLMQVFSIVQWHHFAFMIIALALMGFGASGTLLAVAERILVKKTRTLMPALAATSALAMPVVVWMSQREPLRFDSFLVLAEGRFVPALLLTCVVLVIPFLNGALVIALALRTQPKVTGGLYAANLVGSGCGAAVLLCAMDIVPPHQLPAITAIPAVLAALLLCGGTHPVRSLLGPLIAAAVCLTFILLPEELAPSQFKAISRARMLPEAKILHEQNSRHGFVQVVSSPALRSAPGLSTMFRDTIPPSSVVFRNGDWYGAIPSWKLGDTDFTLRHTTLDLPFAMRRHERVLVLQAGTGIGVAHALSAGSNSVTAVESHAAVLSYLRSRLDVGLVGIFHNPAVVWIESDARSFLARDRACYDVVVLPLLDAFGGTSGVYALHEQYLLTTEAFNAMWDRLMPEGMLVVSSWVDHPYRSPLKVLAMLLHLLRGRGVQDVHAHLAAVRSWGSVTFVVKRTPLTAEEIGRARSFTDREAFDPALLPDIRQEERDRFNRLEDRNLLTAIDSLLTDRGPHFVENYDFAIAPPTDNRPYFSQFLRFGHIMRVRELLGTSDFAFIEVGTLVLVLAMGLTLACILFLFVVPLLWRSVRARLRGTLFLYFGALGAGYMFTEMVLIQRCALYFGDPISSAAVVVGALLVFSGVGSLVSSRLSAGPTTVCRSAWIVVLLLLPSLLLAEPLLAFAMSLSEMWTVIVLLLVLLPLAACMGIPFPLGLRSYAPERGGEKAWAWGVNGASSVVGTVVAAFLAVQWGFHVVALGAAAAYVVAALAGRRL